MTDDCLNFLVLLSISYSLMLVVWAWLTCFLNIEILKLNYCAKSEFTLKKSYYTKLPNNNFVENIQM